MGEGVGVAVAAAALCFLRCRYRQRRRRLLAISNPPARTCPRASHGTASRRGRGLSCAAGMGGEEGIEGRRESGGGGSQAPEGLGAGPWSYSYMAAPAVSACRALLGHGVPRAFLQPLRVFVGKSPSSGSLCACGDGRGRLASAVLRDRGCPCACAYISTPGSRHGDPCLCMYMWCV